MVDAPRNDDPILLFDGICNLCHNTVRFVVKRDKRVRFRFASLQSTVAQDLLSEYGEPASDLNSVILIYRGRVWKKSSAALKTAGELDGLWPAMLLFQIVPRFIRDRVYDYIGNHRYQWFGKRTVCDLPDIADNSRFLH